jgi:transposase
MAQGTKTVSDIEPAHGMNQVKHRRRWTFFQKLRVAQEASVPGMTVTSVARKYGIAPSQLFRWRKLLLNGGQEIDSAGDQGFAYGELLDLKRRMGELERLLGRATVENELLRQTVVLGQSRMRPGKDRGPFTDRHR